MNAPGFGTPGSHLFVLGAVVLLHAVAILLLVTMRYQQQDRRNDLLQTFSIAEPDQPAEPEPVVPSEPPPQAVAAAAPPVTTPEIALVLPRETAVAAAPVEPIRSDPAPVPVANPVPQAAPTASPAPVPAAAPAGPTVPPDFSADQLGNAGPAYPYLSRKAREEGVVTLRVLVSAEGRTKELTIQKSSGFDRLDDAALKSVRKWRFLPARRAGQTVEAWVIVPVTFSLG